MLIRDPILDDVIPHLVAWATKLKAEGVVEAAYLFGSAIQENGVRFMRATSDLDLVVRVPWEGISIDLRLAALERLVTAKLELEAALLAILQRDSAADQIASLVPMTMFEVAHAVHKDGHSTIITRSPMLDLLGSELLPALNADALTDQLDPSHRSALQFVQKKRAAYLSRTANRKGGFGTISPEGSDPIPKELMRQFALATADPRNLAQDASDTTRGLEEISHFSRTAGGLGSVLDDFKEYLAVRLGARGTVSHIMRPAYYLACVEGIYDKASDQYPGEVVIALNASTGALDLSPPVMPPLAATFAITASNRLAGKVADVQRSIINARTNLATLHPEPFLLTFEEHRDGEHLLGQPDATLSKSEHATKVEVYRRRAVIARIEPQLKRGIHMILYYGGTLFDCSANELPRHLVRSVDAFVRHMFSVGMGNSGGRWDALHSVLYPGTPHCSFSFRADDADPGGLGVVAGVMQIPSKDRSVSFVPELVCALLRREALVGRKLARPDLDQFFEVGLWEYGYH